MDRYMPKHPLSMTTGIFLATAMAVGARYLVPMVLAWAPTSGWQDLLMLGFLAVMTVLGLGISLQSRNYDDPERALTVGTFIMMLGTVGFLVGLSDASARGVLA